MKSYKRFYKELFSEKSNEIQEVEEFLGPETAATCPKISEQQKQTMEWRGCLQRMN